MNALDLVAPDYREAAAVIPIFDYDAQPVAEIRAALLQVYEQTYGSPDAVAKEEVWIAREGEPPVRALLYRPKTGSAGGAILHIHGGGWIAGAADVMAGFCSSIADRHGVIVLSVDYRLVPESPGHAAAEDCFTALSWLHAQSGRLGINPGRIAVMGDSAGGNLAAGLAVRARDTGLPVRAQLLMYPALDDRTAGPEAPVGNAFAGAFVLSPKYLRQLWQARLAEAAPEHLRYMAPARVDDLAGMAPAFIAVGSIDVLVDEALDYAGRLGRAGVPVELHVYPGVYHAFDLLPGGATNRLRSDLANAIEAMVMQGADSIRGH